MGRNVGTGGRKARAIPSLCLVVFFMSNFGVGRAAALAPGGQARPDPQYVGSETCKTCHESSFKYWAKTPMGRAFLQHPQTALEKQGCETCHGPGRTHVESGGDINSVLRFGKKSAQSAAEQNASCLQCHEKGARMFWQGSTHERRGLTCVTCHQVMKPNVPSLRFEEPLTKNRQFVKSTSAEVCFQCHLQRRAQLQRSSHMPFREGKITCTNCHNPHGTLTPKLLTENTINENCYKCHAERRGPFLWEHPPVMENCANCHDAHGTSRPQMLKASMPRLCQQCHVVNRHNTTPTQATNRAVFGRSCANCHSQIHGSNHPSGVWYQR